MNLCEICEENEACIHITQMDGTDTSTRHLCEECAVEEGIQLPMMNDDEFEEEEAEEKIVKSCSRCGTTEEDFSKDFRAGCSRCYSVFSSEIEDHLRVKSGPRFYSGKQYRVAGSRAFKSELECLREELRDAVSNQKFEVASVLRDRIKSLEHQVATH